MTILGKMMSFFPALVVASTLASIWWFAASPSLWAAFAVVASLYGLPPVAFRIHQRFHPLKEGGSRLVGGYSAWYGSHQIQLIYLAFPALEAVLRMVPGLFSAWLRLWGSKVGRDVYWTPLIEISDRSLLEIGDRVVFGHRAGAYPHVIKPRRNNLLLYVKRIRIGSDSFVGAGSVLAPGVVVHEGAFVAAGAHVHPNEEVRAEEKKRPAKRADDGADAPTPVADATPEEAGLGTAATDTATGETVARQDPTALAVGDSASEPAASDDVPDFAGAAVGNSASELASNDLPDLADAGVDDSASEPAASDDVPGLADGALDDSASELESNDLPALADGGVEDSASEPAALDSTVADGPDAPRRAPLRFAPVAPPAQPAPDVEDVS